MGGQVDWDLWNFCPFIPSTVYVTGCPITSTIVFVKRKDATFTGQSKRRYCKKESGYRVVGLPARISCASDTPESTPM